ncbi:hypothetical protein L8T82_07900, partial [Campylobacter sp. IFREMER_LSEM_CL292]|uniref:glycosyltransferase n=1 Tax=Campylobacter sp. IFREMER_LSEM_CL292 TaxID=2911623 RepID=UPI0021E7F4CC
MVKQEVSSFWYIPKGYDGIGLMEILSIKSFIDNGYRFILYTYNLNDIIFNKLNDMFDDFELRDANEIISFERYFSDDRGAGVAAFSDYFRFNMLYKRGGVWVDLDMICLNYIDISQNYIFSQEINNDETKPRITTSFLKFPKGSEFGKKLIYEADQIINNKKLIKWGVIGPWFLAEQVKKYSLQKYAWSFEKTCQISWMKARDFVNKLEFDDSQPFLHLFAEMWRTWGLEKNFFYKDNIYGSLLKKYNIIQLSLELDYINPIVLN